MIYHLLMLTSQIQTLSNTNMETTKSDTTKWCAKGAALSATGTDSETKESPSYHNAKRMNGGSEE